MYDFARRPAWIVSHVLVVLLIVVLVNLGLWQLRRHDERADRNAAIEARSEQPAADLTTLLAGPDPVSTGEIEYRAVTVAGEYLDVSLEIDNRSMDGLPGVWIVGVVDTGDTLVPVVRGFQRRVGSGDVEPVPPPDGDVTVSGTVLGYADRSCGTRADDDGVVRGAACLAPDAVRLALETQLPAGSGGSIVDRSMAPVAVRQALVTDQALAGVPLPPLGAGPHLGYAGQWFVFATIAVVGYPLVLRKVARDRSGELAPS